MVAWSYSLEPVLARTVSCEHIAEESCFLQDKEEKEGGKKSQGTSICFQGILAMI